MNPLTTLEEVKATAPELTSDKSDETLTALINDATIQVLADGFPEYVNQGRVRVPIQELATRYMTLHLASMDSEASAKGIASEKVSVIERTYRSKINVQGWLNTSTWGQMYLRLYKQFANGGRAHVAVIQH
ncbi:hypothetical protein J2Z60_001066 [Lactobacillus colini]|uniref:DUF4054 domain-containing protein n=1 Tax=Lactobacillus colini TaxID=1819254 RepID=A0ABS4MDX5_9LACO|nr:DUF4054 domain-containing protein [Lactobacillus colini]MBP2057891.1 hypothetical protein [Lactobacillus colini]